MHSIARVSWTCGITWNGGTCLTSSPGLTGTCSARAPRFTAPEDLLICKLLAGRPQDLQDVEAVLAAQPHLDLERVRSVLGLIETALGRSDLQMVLARLQGRVPDR